MQQKIHLGMRDMDCNPYHWRSITHSLPLYEEPTILLLPGANINMPKLANGSLKIIEEFSNKINSKRLIGAYYDKFDITAHKTYVQYYVGELTDSLVASFNQNKIPAFHLYCYQFFDKYVKNIFYNADHEVCNISEIERRLQNITVITHCYGSLIAFELERLMLNELSTLGFSEKEALKIQQCLTIVNIASRAPIGKFKSSAIHLLSSADDLWLENWKKESFYSFFQEKYLSAQNKFYAAQPVLNNINGSLLSFSDNEVLFFIPRVSLETGMEHRVSSYIKTEDSKKRITQNVSAVDMFMRMFLEKKTNDPLYSPVTLMNEWKNTPEGHVFCINGERQMSEYQGYLKKCRIGRTILHKSVENENFEEVDALINYWGIPVDLHNQKGCFAILTAVQKQNIEIVKLFLNKMSYNDVMDLRNNQHEKIFFKTVLDTQNNTFIQSVYKILEQKNKRWCSLECHPALQEYCLKQIQNEKDILPLLKTMFDLNSIFTSLTDVIKIARFYQVLDSVKNRESENAKKELLKMIIRFPYKEILFETNEQGKQIVSVLHKENISPVFISAIISARKSYIKNLAKEKLSRILSQATNSWCNKTELSKLLCVFSPEKALKESLYLNKVCDYIMLDGGMTTEVMSKINTHLHKRYTRLLNQILLNETKQHLKN